MRNQSENKTLKKYNLSFFLFFAISLGNIFTIGCQDLGQKMLGLPSFWGDEPPNVIFSSPISGSSGLPSSQRFSVAFDREMNMQSCRIGFSMSPTTTGFFDDLNGTILTFVPSSALNAGTYTFTVTKNCEDKNGLDLKNPFSASISIGDSSTAGVNPEISGMFTYAGTSAACNAGSATMTNFFSTSISNACMGNPTQNTIVINFSHAMNESATLAALSISPSISANYVWTTNSILTIQPDFPLTANQRYIISIGSSAKDLNNLPLTGNVIGTFFVGSGNAAPQVTSMNVLTGSLAGCNAGIGTNTDILTNNVSNGCLGNPSTNSIVMNFNTPMKTNETQAAFGVSPFVSGNFQWSSGNQVLTYVTDEKLQYGTRYTVSLSTAAQGGNQSFLASSVSGSFLAGGNNPSPIVQAIGLASQGGCASTYPGVGSSSGGNWSAASCWWDDSMAILAPNNYTFRGGDNAVGDSTSCTDRNTDNFRIIFNNHMKSTATDSISLTRTSAASTVIRLSSWTWSDCQAVYPFGCRVLDLVFSEIESSCGGSSAFGTAGDFNLTNANFDFTWNGTPAFPYPTIVPSPNSPVYNLQIGSGAFDAMGRSITPFSFSFVSQ
ncbi:Ig-like domain-containing protein [Leptospira andrefontaineae]|uniref:SbsA Ig-like domain-containing protein n=1 Tax=Leptospira andrefontaineae TaxID=2484976 RepID=A0A4R9HAH2_9LEPT|nr:Ig-like domain-containing protein [Leptospira andrefontaineae]TGK43536.1 hypothetical protein EHO65_02530 [Leptospira andrefontaineae]